MGSPTPPQVPPLFNLNQAELPLNDLNLGEPRGVEP